MSKWRDIKAKARAVVHSTFRVPATYITHSAGERVTCSVRVHTKVAPSEAEFSPSSAYVEIDPYVIFDAIEVPAPLNKAYVVISDDEIYRIGVAEPRRENFIKASVTILNPAECAAFIASLPPVEA